MNELNLANEEQNIFEDISEHDGHIFYFHDTEHFTITMDTDSEDGLLNMYRRNKEIDVVEFETIDINDAINLQSSGGISNDANTHQIVEIMKDTSRLLLEGTLELSNTLELDTNVPLIPMPMSSGVTNSNVISRLRSLGHTQRSWQRTRHSLTRHGFTARLYERVVFRSVNVRAQRIALGLTMSAVAVLIGKPQAAVRPLINVARNAAGILVTASAATLNTHRVSVLYSREGRIAPYPGGWATDNRDLQYDITVGQGNSTAWSRRWDVPWRRTRNQVLTDSINIRHRR